MRRKLIPVVLAGLLASTACNRVPSYVIQPDDMAEVLADMRMADAVITVHPSQYAQPSKKMAIKDAIFEKHGITSEQFDTSLVWYGRNTERFSDVNDLTIEILEQRMKEANVLAAGQTAMTVAGDSVDLWNGYPYYVINDKLPTHYLSFSYETDPNWEPGDIYTLKSRILIPGASAQWNLTTEYEDGAVEMITNIISQSESNRQELSLFTDSTRTATRLSGWIRINTLSANKPVIIDSISLTRRRVQPGVNRPYQQRLIEPKNAKDKKVEADSVNPLNVDSLNTNDKTRPRNALLMQASDIKQ